MTRKKWALLILCIILVAGYLKFFYKVLNEKAVAKSADCIIAVDVKRITNTLIWEFVTTPAQWKKVSFSGSGEIGWKEMFILPDYILAFHAAGHPLNAWYMVLEIKDNEDFVIGLEHYFFKKGVTYNGLSEYISDELGIVMLQSGNSVLLANLTVKDKDLYRQVAEELFFKKEYVPRSVLLKNAGSESHLSIQVPGDSFLEENAIVKVNFNNEHIMIDADLPLKQRYQFNESHFSYSANSLLNMGFTQPDTKLYESIPAQLKLNISKALNFDMDSLFLASNKDYQLSITDIKPRIDSAVSYSYDDNFNPVEKLVVNKVLEPSLNFSVKGNNVTDIFNYWKNNDKLERTTSGDLFIPMPFVRSYCQVDSSVLRISSDNYKPPLDNNSIDGIFFLKMVCAHIPLELSSYAPEGILKFISNVESFQISAFKKNNNIIIHGSVDKKPQAESLMYW